MTSVFKELTLDLEKTERLDKVLTLVLVEVQFKVG